MVRQNTRQPVFAFRLLALKIEIGTAVVARMAAHAGIEVFIKTADARRMYLRNKVTSGGNYVEAATAFRAIAVHGWILAKGGGACLIQPSIGPTCGCGKLPHP